MAYMYCRDQVVQGKAAIPEYLATSVEFKRLPVVVVVIRITGTHKLRIP